MPVTTVQLECATSYDPILSKVLLYTYIWVENQHAGGKWETMNFVRTGISKALDGEDDDDIPVPEVTSSAADTLDEEPHSDFVDYIELFPKLTEQF